jgi:tetratricopeptide (TPR) repeat protein
MLMSRPAEVVVLPESVQGIIAARLDTLPVEEKELLQDAAVLGRVFWLGALGRERWTLEARLHALARKEFVTPNRRSSVAGEDEYLFRHALVRDVAYEQVPRAARADKHLAAAEWLESLGRPEDHAEMLAHHYAAALDYSRGAGQDPGVVAERGRIAFRDAGARAFALSAFAAAARFYGLALESWPADDPERPELLLELAHSYQVSGDERQQPALETAREAALSAARPELAAVADALLAEVWWYRAEPARSAEHLERARALVEGQPSSHAKAHVLSQVSRYRMLAGRDEEAIRIGREALAMADQLGLRELQAHALDNIGTARGNQGDAGGLDDLERAVEIALAAGSAEVARASNNLAVLVWALGDLRRGVSLLEKAIAHSERLGLADLARFSRNVRVWLLTRLGHWDEALAYINEFLAACEAGQPHYHEGGMRLRRAVIRLARDDVEAALDDIAKVVDSARRASDPQQRDPWRAGATRVLVEAGRVDEARQLARELLHGDSTMTRWALAELGLVAEVLGHVDEISAVVDRGAPTKWTEAAGALLRGEFVPAADRLEDIGDLELEALTRLRAAERLAADGSEAEADEQLRRSLAFWRSVRATRYVRECEALLGDASEVSA